VLEVPDLGREALEAAAEDGHRGQQRGVPVALDDLGAGWIGVEAERPENLRLDVLGFDDEMLAKFRKFIKEPYGMVLVTGPTGSGKTTTLYASLSEIQTSEDKIITIEDPVEYQLRGITQIPVNEKKGLTFARGLRAILRHDPDKIMIGEIRDEETAAIAVQSALTGHLVFTTVHANNVVDVLGRFLNMNVDLYNFVSALNCVLAQRLVRRLPVGESVVEAILKLVRSARPGPEAGDLGRLISWGPGPRASQALMLAVRARALLDGRFAPSVDDVIELAEPVLKHRMALTFAARAEGETITNVIKQLKARIG